MDTLHLSRLKCSRCLVTFTVEAPRAGEITLCATPGCGLRFWHASCGSNAAKVGIHPRDLKDWETHGMYERVDADGKTIK